MAPLGGSIGVSLMLAEVTLRLSGHRGQPITRTINIYLVDDQSSTGASASSCLAIRSRREVESADIFARVLQSRLGDRYEVMSTVPYRQLQVPAGDSVFMPTRGTPAARRSVPGMNLELWVRVCLDGDGPGEGAP